MRFTQQTHQQRVTFGVSTVAEDLPEEVQQTRARRVMLIATSSASKLVDRLQTELPVSLRLDGVRRHVPVKDAEAARAQAAEAQVDLLVAIGGGSAIGLAKAVALTTSIPIIAVPTTYSGSEGTNVWGLSEGGRKQTGSDPAVLPRSVIYDADVVRGLPAELTVSSGMNALAHAVDAMWAPKANPINAVWASEAMRALFHALPDVSSDPSVNAQGRQQMQYGAYLSAVAFSSAGSSLHHKVCHVLGGAFDLPHAETHAVVLPYVLAYNVVAAEGARLRMRRAFDNEDPVEALQQLRDRIGAPRALKDHGFHESDVPEAARLVAQAAPESNPRRVTLADAQRLVHAVWAGEPPELMRY